MSYLLLMLTFVFEVPLGIMTVETNSTAAYAKTILTDSYNTIMTKGGSYLTQEQREFLDGCEFKVYLIYANGRAGVETIYGLDGFVNCIKKGVFTKDNPGGPLFCTFNNVKDNSPVKVRFKYNIRREPLYVEMKYINNGGLKLYFYRNAAKVPTIADPRMVFRFRRQLQNWGGMGSPLHGGPWGANDKKKYVDETKEIQNAGYQTSVEVYNKNLVGPNFSYDTSGSSVPAWTADRIRVEILPSDNYKIIGSTFYGDEFLCPVDLENNKFYPPFSGNVYVF
ncbi:hypothetical protein SAMN05216365_1705 [Porphyromonadaceae bacterium NLAE-zl-C104]|nr:hypothetical protein SAMN05216331_1862 [Porphyromonadaceae bacterium KH3R12]SFT09846.1 hypothetical protein SAMN05216365_1705 [Porphyromonadaceae bacterium NLAE-zl-C104]